MISWVVCCQLATPGICQALTLFPSSFPLPSFMALQWRTEILDYCPSTRVLLIGCKTDLRTDLSTLMELSHQKQAPISYEQVCVCVYLPSCVLGGETPERGLEMWPLLRLSRYGRRKWYFGGPSTISKLLT